ncbi:MAG: cytochrome c oxidase subunit II [Gemmatimonadota bacterium]
MKRRNALCLIAILLPFTACSGPQYALDPRSPASSSIAQLWWVMLAIASAVSLTVVILLLVAIGRARRRERGEDVREIAGRPLVLTGGVVIPTIVLLSLLVYNFRLGASLQSAEADEIGGLTIEVVGHQFWWEVRYPGHGITTANEITIPAGEPVRFLVSSPDVIHSFWVPQLHGKIDMIPGRLHTLMAEADQPGVFRGQCAEYCGMAHALMAFWVEALQPAEFAAWVEARTAPPLEPEDAQVERGRQVFFEAECGDCHATRGAAAPAGSGSAAPDLADLATRRTIGAGTLPNTPEALARWIEDPQAVKPGARMPPTALEDAEMQALLAYLGSLR